MSLESGDRRVTITQPERGHTVGKFTKVRTTITPGDVIKVEASELLDLERQGLIKSREGDEGWQDEAPVETKDADEAPATDTKKGGK